MKIELHLPWPPSVNHYWGQNGSRRFVKDRGLRYRNAVTLEWRSKYGFDPMQGRVKVKIAAHPPDKRERDVDNLCKCILDSLEKAEVFETDNQIDDLHIIRGERVEGGACVVMVEEMIK